MGGELPRVPGVRGFVVKYSIYDAQPFQSSRELKFPRGKFEISVALFGSALEVTSKSHPGTCSIVHTMILRVSQGNNRGRREFIGTYYRNLRSGGITAVLDR